MNINSNILAIDDGARAVFVLVRTHGRPLARVNDLVKHLARGGDFAQRDLKALLEDGKKLVDAGILVAEHGSRFGTPANGTGEGPLDVAGTPTEKQPVVGWRINDDAFYELRERGWL